MKILALTGEQQDALDMRRLAEGEDGALNDLMERHGERLFHYLIRQIQNDTDAAEIAQESFVRVYQNRARFKQGAKFSTWLYAIATNLVRDRIRYRARHPYTSIHADPGSESGSYDMLPDKSPGPSEAVLADERAALVREAIQDLPEELRTPLILAEYEDLPQAEIASVLKCSVKAVETRIYRARQHLRKRLSCLMKESAANSPAQARETNS